MVTLKELIFTSAAELARAIRAKEVSAEEVVETHLHRIGEVNPKLGAIVRLTADSARAQARNADAALAKGQYKGPLHGVPITIKDNVETAGVICTGGTQGRASFIPKNDATIVKRMRAAGAIILGKTNLPELGLAFETDNLLFGRTNNPYDLSRTPGGSSGGEGAIIAAGGSPLGLGNDMGGSIRLPAHFCGIAGIKPTIGRVSLTGHFPWSIGMLDALWAPGPMARFVEDLILTLPIVAGVDWQDPMLAPMPIGDPKSIDIKDLRVAFYTDNGIMSPTAETVDAVEKAAKVLTKAGANISHDCPEGIEQSYEIFSSLLAADGGAGMEKLLQAVGTTEMHIWTRKLLELHRNFGMTPAEIGSLLRRWTTFKSLMLSFLQRYDVIICPVCAYAAQPHGASMSAEKIPGFSYTMTYNLTGWPSVVVRSGTSLEGLPIGVQIVGRPWREDVVLAVALHIETSLSGWQPPKL
jgi:amidase